MSVEDKIDRARQRAVDEYHMKHLSGARVAIHAFEDALRASGIDLVAADPGYVRVPREPTERMIEAASERWEKELTVWRNMLAAIDKEPELK